MLRVTRGVSEVISTIMLNAIAGAVVGYFLSTYGIRAGNSRRTATIPEGSRVPGFAPFEERDGAIWGLVVLAVVMGLAFSFVLNRTRFGFDLRATGMSETAAVASGVKVSRMVVISMMISGAIAGLLWMPSFFGAAYNYGTTFQGGLGFLGIAVALLGRNQPLGHPVRCGALRVPQRAVQPADAAVATSPRTSSRSPRASSSSPSSSPTRWSAVARPQRSSGRSRSDSQADTSPAEKEVSA